MFTRPPPLKLCLILNGSSGVPLPVTVGALVAVTLPQRLPKRATPPFGSTTTTTKPALLAGCTSAVCGSGLLPRNSPLGDPVKATPRRPKSSDDDTDSGSPVI